MQTEPRTAATPKPKPLPPPSSVRLPERLGYRIKNKILGPPLETDQLETERLGIPTAVAVFSSDCISSSAYATEEILRVLFVAIGVAAFSLVVPLTVAMLVVLFFLIMSYRETIKEYPTAGGAYMVTRDNFGLLPAQIAGVSLLTDYILTVSVSVAAGTAALASAIPGPRRMRSRSPSGSSPSSRSETSRACVNQDWCSRFPRTSSWGSCFSC